MKKKLNFKVLFVLMILLFSIFFTSMLILTDQGPEDYLTRAHIYYDLELTNSQYQEMCDALQNISYHYSFDDFDSFSGAFNFYHRDKSDQIDERNPIQCNFAGDHTEFRFELIMKPHQSAKEDKEMLKSDMNFIIDLLYPILGEPSKTRCLTLK